MLGERLSSLISFEAQKLAACAVLLSPYVPLLFMGEEYGEAAPFLYFISHEDEALARAVHEGRKAEFAAFKWQGEPPDPQSLLTFRQSKLDWERRSNEKHKIMLAFYATLLQLRKTIPALTQLNKQNLEVRVMYDTVLYLRRWEAHSQIMCVMNFAAQPVRIGAGLPEGNWEKLLDSADAAWAGPGSAIPQTMSADAQPTLQPHSCVIFSRIDE
jgi:maltooligosyltrehalose trehalohydrolase